VNISVKSTHCLLQTHPSVEQDTVQVTGKTEEYKSRLAALQNLLKALEQSTENLSALQETLSALESKVREKETEAAVKAEGFRKLTKATLASGKRIGGLLTKRARVTKRAKSTVKSDSDDEVASSTSAGHSPRIKSSSQQQFAIVPVNLLPGFAQAPQ